MRPTISTCQTARARTQRYRRAGRLHVIEGAGQGGFPGQARPKTRISRGRSRFIDAQWRVAQACPTFQFSDT
jgi:hypothetical protein